jgi:hypothetical protein
MRRWSGRLGTADALRAVAVRDRAISDPADESDPVAEGVDFATVIGLQVESEGDEDTPAEESAGRGTDLSDTDASAESSGPGDGAGPEGGQPVTAEVEQNRAALVRLRVLADLLPRFWSGVSWQEPWRWHITIDRRGLRPYREIRDVSQLLDLVDRERESLSRQQASVRVGWQVLS